MKVSVCVLAVIVLKKGSCYKLDIAMVILNYKAQEFCFCNNIIGLLSFLNLKS